MRKEKDLSNFIQELEMTVLSSEEQFLVGKGGDDADFTISGNTVGYCPTTNNCQGGNCVKGCGSSD